MLTNIDAGRAIVTLISYIASFNFCLFSSKMGRMLVSYFDDNYILYVLTIFMQYTNVTPCPNGYDDAIATYMRRADILSHIYAKYQYNTRVRV